MLVNPLGSVLCGFPAFANVGEILVVVVVVALYTNGSSHHLRSHWSLWGCKSGVILLKFLWVLVEGE